LRLLFHRLRPRYISQNNFNIKWDNVQKERVEKYSNVTGVQFHKMKLNHEMLACKNPNCDILSHVFEINNMYKDLIKIIINDSSSTLSTEIKHTNYNVPGWNELCEQAHSEARNAFLLWRANGSKKRIVSLS
jgi:hypothetical protein